MGLDPGIDHMTAMRIFDDVRSKGGRITSFVSWCGGLPAPEASDNPLGYKFSWSPRGVLTAGLNDAQFKRNGKVGFLYNVWRDGALLDTEFPPCLDFECSRKGLAQIGCPSIYIPRVFTRRISKS